MPLLKSIPKDAPLAGAGVHAWIYGSGGTWRWTRGIGPHKLVDQIPAIVTPRQAPTHPRPVLASRAVSGWSGHAFLAFNEVIKAVP